MTSGVTSGERMVLMNALHGLIDAARTARALLPMAAPERAFYLGVEAAAKEALHTEAIGSKPIDWLDNESGPFREGYLAMSADLAAVAASGRTPLALRLPEPTRR